MKMNIKRVMSILCIASIALAGCSNVDDKEAANKLAETVKTEYLKGMNVDSFADIAMSDTMESDNPVQGIQDIEPKTATTVKLVVEGGRDTEWSKEDLKLAGQRVMTMVCKQVPELKSIDIDWSNGDIGPTFSRSNSPMCE